MEGARIGRQVAVAVDHPALAGHFPGRPMLPGVALLSFAMEAAAADPVLAKAIGPAPLLTVVKFVSPVGPGATLDVDVRLEQGSVAFRIDAAGEPVAVGKFARADLGAEAGR